MSTAAGDIYALGVVAYEALVGRRPYTGKTQVDIAFAHVNEPLPPLPGHIDARVRAVVEQMLAKDPEQRPRSAASLARALEELARDLHVAVEPVDTPPNGTPGPQLPPAGGHLSRPATGPTANDATGPTASGTSGRTTSGTTGLTTDDPAGAMA